MISENPCVDHYCKIKSKSKSKFRTPQLTVLEMPHK